MRLNPSLAFAKYHSKNTYKGGCIFYFFYLINIYFNNVAYIELNQSLKSICVLSFVFTPFYVSFTLLQLLRPCLFVLPVFRPFSPLSPSHSCQHVTDRLH